MWVTAAVCSAVFAGLTAILSKIGVKNCNSDVANAVRTSVVLALAWLIVLITGAHREITAIDARSVVFLLLSGAATGASWICYFKALSKGDVSKVAAVDKSSVIFTILFALIFLAERTLWWVKLLCLTAIAVGSYLMLDIKQSKDKENLSWFLFALISALFASATSILAKIGIENVNSNLATAIRTCVVFIIAWCIVFYKKQSAELKQVPRRDLVFLLLSGTATAASWLCFYYAIRFGQVSVVVPIDKLGILITVVFSRCILKEKLSVKAWIGLTLLTIGTVFMAVFT